jgi:putative transposase
MRHGGRWGLTVCPAFATVVAAQMIRRLRNRHALPRDDGRSGPEAARRARVQPGPSVPAAACTARGRLLRVEGIHDAELLFIEHGTRWVHLAGLTAHPTGGGVTRQARNLMMTLEDHAVDLKFLIQDRDAKFTAAFDAVFVATGVRIIRTPVQASRANALAERWIASGRRECLDRMLITGERHMRLVLSEYTDHYDGHRPHQDPPAGHVYPPGDVAGVRVLRRDRLGGLIHEYSQVA